MNIAPVPSLLRSLTPVLFCFYLTAQTPSADYLAGLKNALARADKAAVDRISTELISSDATKEELLSAGGLLGEKDYLEQSADVFERCVAKYPGSFEAHYNLALANVALQREGKAEEALKSMTAASAREQAALQYLHGKIYGATGLLKEALDSLQAAYDAQPDQENYALDLALVELRNSAYVPAMQVLQRAAGYHPQAPEIRLELALAYALAGRTSDAIALCHQLEGNSDESSATALIAAFARCASGDYHGCSAEATRGLQLPRPRPYLHYLHAMAQWNQPLVDSGAILHELNMAVAAIPACAVCLQLRSRVYEAARNFKAAIADLDEVTRQDTASASAWYRLAELYKKVGDKKKSGEAMSRFRAMHTLRQDQEAATFRDQVIGAH